MEYNSLQMDYWNRQKDRVSDLHVKINSNGLALAPGRTIPDEDDLALGEGRRLKMAVLFLDISKFSVRDLELEAEQNAMLKALNLFFTEMIKIAEDYGGTVEKNTGDGLMAYFEDGADKNACKRAVACAMTMFAANNILISPKLNANFMVPFDFRISIEYGWVTIAKLGAAKRFNACVAIGRVANFAAKMLSKALSGDIVIGDFVLKELPPNWQMLATNLPSGSGWVYKISGAPYNLYKFTGRWTITQWMTT